MGKYNASNVLDGGWHSDCKEWREVEALSIVAVGHEIRRLRSVMQSILYNLQSLGADGIHDVIKREAQRARLAKKRLATRRRKARLAKLAVTP